MIKMLTSFLFQFPHKKEKNFKNKEITHLNNVFQKIILKFVINVRF